jgi:hypothetical protein
MAVAACQKEHEADGGHLIYIKSVQRSLEIKDAEMEAMADVISDLIVALDALIQERDEARAQLAAAFSVAAEECKKQLAARYRITSEEDIAATPDDYVHPVDAILRLTPADAARQLERKVLKAEYSGREAGHASKCQQCLTGNCDCWELLAIRKEGYKKLSDLQRQLDALAERG